MKKVSLFPKHKSRMLLIATVALLPFSSPSIADDYRDVVIADAHVHLLDFLQNSDYLDMGEIVEKRPGAALPVAQRGKRIEAVLWAMDRANVSSALITGMPFLKKVIAEAVLQHHGIAKEEIISSYLPISDMVHRIHSGEIDAGLFVSGTPSQSVQTLLNDPELALARIGLVEQARIVESAAFTPTVIKPDSAAAGLREAEPSIPTIATQAVLVTAEDLPFDVKTITAAIFEGAAFLAIKGSTETEDEAKTRVRRMAEDLPSLPLHPDARAYYEEAGHLPASETWMEQFIDWLTATWQTLTTLVVLATAGGAFIKLKRDRTANSFGRRILAVPLEVSEPSAASKLLEIQTELLERVHRRWWRLGELDKPRWRYLHDLIEDRVRQAQEKRAQALIGEFRQHGEDSSGEQAQQRDRQTILTQRLWQLFETGELEASQYELLMKLVQKYGGGLAANK